MTDSSIAKSTPETEERQERELRTELLRGAVTPTELVEVEKAFDDAGFRSQSEGIRTLSLLFARLPDLRAIIAAHRLAA